MPGTLTFGQLLPIIEHGARATGVDVTSRPAVVAYAVKVLCLLGQHPGDADTNALVLATMMGAM